MKMSIVRQSVKRVLFQKGGGSIQSASSSSSERAFVTLQNEVNVKYTNYKQLSSNLIGIDLRHR
jgi:hypothetical protein